jgi:hypothetical protein
MDTLATNEIVAGSAGRNSVPRNLIHEIGEVLSPPAQWLCTWPQRRNRAAHPPAIWVHTDERPPIADGGCYKEKMGSGVVTYSRSEYRAYGS